MTTFQQIQDEDDFDIDIDQLITSKPTPSSPINESNNDKHSTSNKIDTNALNGLRGVLALHIMLHHSFQFSKLQLSLLGGIQMPLFFLISGFILALNDGSKKIYSNTKCCSELKKFTSSDEAENKFNARNFYLRRIARTVPLYYLSNLIVEPLVFFGYSSLVSPGIMNYISILTTLTITGSWFGPFILNLPSWFVSTIWFFYWIFPSLIPKLQKYSVSKMKSWIIYHYIIQIITGAAIFIGFQMVPGLNDFAFNISTMWPPSRLPIFIMGILCGLLRNNGYETRNSLINYTKQDWNRYCNYLCLGLNLALIIGVIVEAVTNGVVNIELWLQLIIVWFQMEFVYSLTCCDGITYKILTNKLCIFFGRISYSLYLIHFPIIGYICFILNGKQSMPSCSYNDIDDDPECNDQWSSFLKNRLQPIWCIPIHCVMSLIIAVILNRYFEEPLRKWLRPKNN